MWPHRAWLALGLALALACAEEPAPLVERVLQGPTMGTHYTVKVVVPAEDFESESAGVDIEALLAAVNAAMSTYDPNSELSRFNADRSTKWRSVSPDLAFVVAEALRIGEATAGALDVTIGPLVNLWGFGPEIGAREVPDPERLAEIRRRVGLHHLSLRTDPPGLRKGLPNLYVDLSAIAKGFAVDKLSEYLLARGVSSFMVEVGGEVRVSGTNGQGVPWRIGVESPTPSARAVQRVLQPGESGLATSGDYRNFFEAEGKRYSHTLDPATGQPVEHTLASVTVLHASAMTADGLATALMVMGPEAGLAYATEQNLPVYMISNGPAGFEEIYSPAFEERL
jgi:thiamine biosynthesis lipoprotein